MEPHAIPRQVTTFEFKLIGFLTLKQFIYIIIFAAIGVILYLGFPVPILNILFAACAVSLGLALAFLPINERPLDVWIRNLINRLLQPSQFYYHKKNDPPQFLKDVYFQSTNAQIVSTHIDARQKLSGYINNTKAPETDVIQKNQIHQLIASDNTTAVAPAAASMSAPVMTAPQPVIAEPMTQPITPEPHVQSPVINTPTPIPIQTVPPIVNTSPSVVSPNTQAQTANINNPFLGGHIQNSKGIPLSNIMIYIKNHDGKILRILKSNSSGQFATYHALNPGDYLVEPKDIGQKYFFDTMKIKIDTVNPGPLTIVSKELL